MKFKNLFDQPAAARRRLPAAGGAGDFRSGTAYCFTPDMELAVSAAGATQRPLLLTGPAGCGKSSLARSSAARLGWRYLERTINSRTEIHSLLWEVDQLNRLQDANLKQLDDDLLAYVRPSVLWQALDARTAADPRLLRQPLPAARQALDPAVVLIDEIDKADPDLPNNLLEVLGGLRFEVADTGCRVGCHSGVPLIVITSNDERDLPPAFVRRCIVLNLPQPDLAMVGALHFPKDGKTVQAALALLTGAGAEPPSAAEFLDFVQACKALQVRPGSAGWARLAEACVRKGRGG
jgi:MoxR-like ATPase